MEKLSKITLALIVVLSVVACESDDEDAPNLTGLALADAIKTASTGDNGP